MILTTCAACAAPLAHDAPRCVRCKLRYCNATCQHDHWRRGHKQMCKKIHRGGNAEQYHADKKYKEAVAEAVEACAEDIGRDHSTTFGFCRVYARSLFCGAEGSRAELEEALTVLEDVAQRIDRVRGASHPERVGVEHELDAVRKLLGSSQEDQNAADAPP